jgi:glucose-6-phosphate 1-dehydrogenase
MEILIPEPAIIVIFGITGDLVKRKLLPALNNLIQAGLLHEKTVIVGVTRQNIDQKELIARLTNDETLYDKTTIDALRQKLIVQTMDITKSSEYEKLLVSLNSLEDKYGVCLNRLYYLSIPPQVFMPIVRYMGENGLNTSCQHGIAETRLLVEKPFGYDYDSAEELIKETSKYFKEEQVFRIDHYLAKETVQNILSFRFSNAVFESVWDNKNIGKIEITAIEKIGIEGRSVFYEQVGALRDIIQSHLLQLMAVVMMEEPKVLESKEIHKSKLELLESVVPISKDEVSKLTVRAQYETYRNEVNNPKSRVETFAAIKVSINNSRWSGVPIILKTGKKLSEKKTEVSVIFKPSTSDKSKHNRLTFRIQPNEGIQVELFVKKPGLDNQLEAVDMDFSYSRFFDAKSNPDAYERVLVDAIKGDRTLFTTSQEVLAAWKIVDPILEYWSQTDDGLLTYKNDSAGPSNLPDWLEETL